MNYKSLQLDCGYRLDFLVEKTVILELKAVDGLLPIHEAQLLTYLKLGGCPLRAQRLCDEHSERETGKLPSFANGRRDEPVLVGTDMGSLGRALPYRKAR